MKADAAAFEALAQQVDGALRALGVVEPDDVPGEREGGEPTVVALALGHLDGALGRAERPVATRSRPIPLPVTSRRDAGPYAGRSSDRPEFPYRAIWISSVHLGTRDCKADLLIDFMRQTESEYLYLIGDIFDGVKRTLLRRRIPPYLGENELPRIGEDGEANISRRRRRGAPLRQ